MKLSVPVVIVAQAICALALPAINVPAAAAGASTSAPDWEAYNLSPPPTPTPTLPTGPAVNQASSTGAASAAVASYEADTQAAVYALQSWYNNNTGLWSSTGWWNSANCLTMLADYAIAAPAAYPGIQYVFTNTYKNGPSTNSYHAKVIIDSLITTTQTDTPSTNENFLDEYYDDEGWWAMGWIRVFDLTGNPEYLEVAAAIFEDMTGGFTATCGGMWWDKTKTAQVAIANELMLDVAASLANRATFLNNATLSKTYFLDWAIKEWQFFNGSGMINSNYNINDGLDPSTCKNNGGTVWSYNQGVILGGLVELNEADPNPEYLTMATQIASAAIKSLSDTNGTLHESCEPNCGADGTQFKGIFMRNLQILNKAAPNANFTTFIQHNANTIWTNNRNSKNQFSVDWSAYNSQYVSASTQSSAMDALVAAIAIS